MNILLVEDEPLALAQLEKLILRLFPSFHIVGRCDTIKSTLDWIQINPMPDLAFFDIQLGDGSSFEIFKRSDFYSPVIFTTAFSEYAIDAFKVNSIDYLLKPIEQSDLENSIRKFLNSSAKNPISFSDEVLLKISQNLEKKSYKQRFVVKVGINLRAVLAEDISFFYSLQKSTYLCAGSGKNYDIDSSIDRLVDQLDPRVFFRINRQYVVALSSIENVTIVSNSRLKLKVKHAIEDNFFVARERVKDFKKWYEGDF